MAKGFPNTGATVIDSSTDLPAASAALEGVMMFQKDTNELKICDGSSWISMLDTDVPPATQLIAVNTPSSSTNSQFLNKFSSAFTNYRILISLTSAAADSYLCFRLLNSSNVASATGYYGGGYRVNQSGTGSANNQNNGVFGFIIDTGTGPAAMCSMDLLSPFATNNSAWNTLGVSNGSINIFGNYYCGIHNSASSYPGIEFYLNSGGAFSGTIRLYGYRDSI